jgi:DNA-binding transcriptional regulator YhcF (GntR family)
MVEDMESEPLVIQLDEVNPLPKYMQIVEQIRAFASAGKLAPGSPLPSTRQLATDLGININTVLAAYHTLEAEEIILLRHGARAVIHPRLRRPATPQAGDIAHIRTLLGRVRTDAVLCGMSLPMLREIAAEIFATQGSGLDSTAIPRQERN